MLVENKDETSILVRFEMKIAYLNDIAPRKINLAEGGISQLLVICNRLQFLAGNTP
jgi:hypothetical protein